MLGSISGLLTVLAALLVVPVLTFCVEIIAAHFASSAAAVSFSRRINPRVAVLVPARNESTGILRTLKDIQSQLGPRDRLVVIADNCTDDTAAVAKAAGAEVTERSDLTHVGKGYALDWGLKFLEADPPEIVVMIDADCRL
jgi:cellulose synthase/poly-beta-1,6-N-acetylglucosamine synthase-like glycosyltransferase